MKSQEWGLGIGAKSPIPNLFNCFKLDIKFL